MTAHTILTFCLLSGTLPFAYGKTSRGDLLLAQARATEAQGTSASLDEALALAKEALATDPGETEYILTVARIRAFAAQQHVHDGNLLLTQRKPAEALIEYRKAAAVDPAPSVALQEIRRTQAILGELKAHPERSIEELLLSPLAQADKRAEKLFESIKPLPRLQVQLSKPLPRLRVNGQSSAEVFALIARLAGIRILFDPDYLGQSLGRNQLLDLSGLSLEEALDDLSLVSKSYWKPVSADTIFVSGDDPARHALFDDQMTKVLYLTNAPGAQEVQNIANTVRAVTDIKKLLVHPEQNAIVLRTDQARAALAEKVVKDLDKPRAEIIIDVLILSVSKDWVRDLGVVLGITPGNLAATFAPRAILGAVAGTGSGGPTIPMSSLSRLATGDFAVTLPGTALNALLQTRGTKVLDKAQLRTIEGQKSTLKIGQKVPYATGSFAPGAVGGSVSSLVNTQFQFFDVGLNIEVTAKVHDPDEVSLHIESDHSSVADYTNLGGVVQPVISQRKRVADVRVKEGEVNFWDIVTSRQSLRTATGIPGLSQLPLVGHIFTNQHREETEDQLLHLLIPHIVRSPDIRGVNVEAVPSGSDLVVRLNYAGQHPAGGTSEETIDVPQGPPPPAPTAPAPGVSAPAPSVPASPGAPPSLAFSLSPQEAAPGTLVRIELVATGATDINVVSAAFKFDPAVLACRSIEPGGLLLADGRQPAVTQEIRNDVGTATIDLTRGEGAGVSGSGSLVTLQCVAKQAGASPFATSSLTLLNSRRLPLPAAPLATEIVAR